MAAGAFYFVRTLVQYIEDPEVDDNMYNRNALPNRGVGWLISTMFFVCSIMVRVQKGGCMHIHHWVHALSLASYSGRVWPCVRMHCGWAIRLSSALKLCVYQHARPCSGGAPKRVFAQES